MIREEIKRIVESLGNFDSQWEHEKFYLALSPSLYWYDFKFGNVKVFKENWLFSIKLEVAGSKIFLSDEEIIALTKVCIERGQLLEQAEQTKLLSGIKLPETKHE